MLDEFVAVTGYHRKHALRLLNQAEPERGAERVGRRIYDEAVRAALIVVWETADRTVALHRGIVRTVTLVTVTLGDGDAW